MHRFPDVFSETGGVQFRKYGPARSIVYLQLLSGARVERRCLSDARHVDNPSTFCLAATPDGSTAMSSSPWCMKSDYHHG